MKRYSLLPLVVVAGVVIACSTRAWSQTREPMVLPNLLWLQQGPPQSAAMMWPLPNSSVSNPTPIIQDFEIGWNWTSVSWNMGRLLGVRRYHCSDFRQDADLAVRSLDAMRRSRVSFPGLVNLAIAKMAINKARTWQTGKNINDPVEHVRSESEAK
jgi:hypothetical protein